MLILFFNIPILWRIWDNLRINNGITKHAFDIFCKRIQFNEENKQDKKDAKDILQKILEVYPNNNAITFQLLKYNIKDSTKLVQSMKKLKDITENNKNNPVAYKLLAEGYEKIKEK